MFSRLRAIFISGLCLIVLFSCDFMSETGNSGGMARVIIPLDDSTGLRAIGKPREGISVTGYTISIFGPGMRPVEKYISRGAKYVTLDIPAGQDRHFTIEVHFTISDPVLFPYSHLRSFKAREIADLRPGRVTGLTMNLVAGATDLLVPDNRGMNIVSAGTIAWNSPTTASQSFTPTDIEIAADGRIFASSDYGKNALFTGTSASSALGQFGNSPLSPVALAMDRENNTLYYATSTRIYSTPDSALGTSPSYLMSTGTATIASVQGMAFDPWDRMLYIVGTLTVGTTTTSALIKYNPAYTDGKSYGAIVGYVNQAACPDIYTLRDVIVKDSGVFVLNVLDLKSAALPCLMKFSRDLVYQGGYGTLSKTGSTFTPSIAPGAFYFPQRFFAQENEGLFIIDDSLVKDTRGDDDYDKLIYIGEDLSSLSWKTFPLEQPYKGLYAGETFTFFL